MASKDMSLAIKIKGQVDPSLNSAFGKVTSGVQKAGQVLGTVTMAAAAAVGAVATAAINVGREFEQSMSQVQATMLIDTSTQEGIEAYQTLENAARECGRTTAFSATEAAEGLNYLALAGYDATQAADALPVVLQLAGAGAMDLADASDMLTDAMSALNIEATQENLTTFSDQMAAAASNANTSVEQLGEGIIKIGGTAANLAGGTVELNTALGILANNGIKGAEGGTHLRNMILKLQNPTSDAAAKMQELGVSVYDAEGNMNSLQDIFGDLQSSMDGWSQEDVDSVLSTLFNKTDLAAANALLSDCGDAWDDLYDSIENSAGACEDMYNIQLDNLNGDISKLTSALSDLGISLYQDMQEPLRDVAQTATDMVLQLSDAYAEGGLEGMIGEIGNVVAELATMLAEAAPGLVQAGMNLIGSFLEGIGQAAPQIASAAMETVTTFISGLGTLLPQLITCGVQLVTSLLEGLAQGLPQLIMSGLEMINGLVQGIVQNIPVLIQSGVQIIVSLIQGVSSNIGNIVQTAVDIILALVNGLISAIPYLIAAVPQIISALMDAILNTDWISLGVQIVTSIGEGILGAVGNLGSTIMGAITGLFGGGEADSSANSSGQAVSNSYAAGIESNTSAVNAATDSLTANAFSNVDTSAANAAGAETVEAYTSGLDESLAGYEFDTSAIGLDSAALSEDMSQAAQESGQAFTEGLDTSISEYTFDTSAIGVDTAALSATMNEAGATGGESLTEGLNSAVAATTVDTSAIAVDSSGIVSSMQQAGTEGANALATGIQSGGAAATAAAQALMQAISQALTSGWSSVQSQASSAMSSLTSTVRSGAQTAANAVKSAFSNMTITIPKPRIPVINVSYRTESYGDGGSVKIPSFSVSWNALGGIFDDPTIFNSAQGLQGVGEAGPEAITPLDTMWEQIREIMTDVLNQNGGGSTIDSLVNKLGTISNESGSTSGQAYEMSGAGEPTITYAPVYNLNGTATKEDAIEAEKISQDEFAKLMKQYEKQNARTKF